MLAADGSVRKGNFGQDLWTVSLFDLTNGEEKVYWGDGGLKGAFTLAKVNPGMAIEIVHTGEKEHVGDFDATLQTYEIYELET